jgi:hypothetical protein
MTWYETLGAAAAVLTLAAPATGLAQQTGSCETNCAKTSCCCNGSCVVPGRQGCDMACAAADAKSDGKKDGEAVATGSYKGPFSTAANGDYLLAGKVTVPKKNVSQIGQTLSIWMTWDESLDKSTFSWPPATRAAAVGTGLHYFHMCKVCDGRGGCDATWCMGSGSHVDCDAGKAITSCDRWL